jgi:hypothetical protein
LNLKTLWNLRQLKIQSKCETWGNLRTWEIKQKEKMNYYLLGVLERRKHSGKALETWKEIDQLDQLKKIPRRIDQSDQLKETPWRVDQPEQLN